MANIYDRGKLELTNGATTWTSSTIGVLLVGGSYVYSVSHAFVSDLTGELTNVGYVRQTLGGKAGPTLDTVNHRIEYTGASVTFPSLGAGTTPAAAIVYRNTGVDGTSPLIAYLELEAAGGGPPNPPNGGNYTIDIAAEIEGIMQLLDN